MNTFIQLFVLNTMMLFANANSEQPYQYYQPNSVNRAHPAVKHRNWNHPLSKHPFVTFTRRGLESFSRLDNSLSRQVFAPRQGDIGASSSISSLLGLGLFAAFALGTVAAYDLSNKVDNKAGTSEVTAAVSRITSLESSTSAICTNIKKTPITRIALTTAGSGAGKIAASGFNSGASAQILEQINIIERALQALYDQNSATSCT